MIQIQEYWWVRIRIHQILGELKGFYCRTKTVCRSAGWHWQYDDDGDDHDDDDHDDGNDDFDDHDDPDDNIEY